MSKDEVLASLKVTSRFKIDQVLGKGAFATVYQAEPRYRLPICHGSQGSNHDIVALKLINAGAIAERRKNRKMEKGLDVNVQESADDQEDNTEELFFPSRVRDRAPSERHKDHNELNAVRSMIQREIEVHRYASKKRHPNIVSLLDSLCYKTERNRTVTAMVIEYCPFGDLHSCLRQRRNERKHAQDKLPGFESTSPLLHEDEARHVLRHILRGLAFLHSHGIAHRDIKPANILIAPCYKKVKKGIGDCNLLECSFKIGDFGLAVKMQDEDDWDQAQDTLCGTPSCLAPEVAQCTPKRAIGNRGLSTRDCNDANSSWDVMKESVQKYGQPADLWSSGCILYAMLIGSYPFSRPQSNDARHDAIGKEKRLRETIARAAKGHWSIPDGINVNDEVRSLLEQLLSLDPKKRGFARGLLSMHPFFEGSVQTRRSTCNNRSRLSHRVTSSESGSSNHKEGRSSDLRMLEARPRVKRYEGSTAPANKRKMNNQQGRTSNPLASSIGRGSEDVQNVSSRDLVCPILELTSLIPSKYEWKEQNSKRTIRDEVKTLLFALFVLPRAQGVVIQCERLDTTTGAWMHVIGNGRRVCVGKLGTSPIVKNNGDILREAFERMPRAYKKYHSFVGGNDCFEQQTVLSSLKPFQNSTLCSMPSTNSMPITSAQMTAQKLYKPLSKLLTRKYRTYLFLYRKLESVVSRLSQSLSRLSIQVHHNIYNHRNEICTVATPCNGKARYIVIFFKDGVEIRFNSSIDAGELFENGSRVATIILNNSSKSLSIADGRQRGRYSFHQLFAYQAICNCIDVLKTEESIRSVNESHHLTTPVIVIAKGRSSKDWHILKR